MNVSKNYSDICADRLFINVSKYTFYIVSLLFICINVSAAEYVTDATSAINLSDYFKVMLGLTFVIALFLASIFLFKRFGNGSMAGRGQIRLIDGLHLGSRERLVLVELKGKQILLSITPGQINKLDTIDINSLAETTDA